MKVRLKVRIDFTSYVFVLHMPLMNVILLVSLDIITCQSIYRRNVAIKETCWLLHSRHEEACAGFIQEIWRAYVARERFVRVIANMDRPKKAESKSATEIAKAWRAFTAQRKYESIVKGEPVLCLLLFGWINAHSDIESHSFFRCNAVPNCHTTQFGHQ